MNLKATYSFSLVRLIDREMNRGVVRYFFYGVVSFHFFTCRVTAVKKLYPKVLTSDRNDE
jgi:hypothetical protein